jgi:hypothetical protein
MKRNILLIIISSLPFFMHAQTLPDKVIMVTGGYSKHGSGDMKGIVFGAGYAKYISSRVSLDYYFRGSINNGQDVIMINNGFTGIRQDASIRFTTAGVQAGMNVRLSFIRTKRNELLISLGGFGRYQSASNGSDGYALYYPSTTGVPTVLVEYNNRTPQKTYAFGGLLQLHYNFTFNKNIVVGIAPGFQTDTNGDALLQGILVVGKRFK